MIQIDGIKKRVFIKLIVNAYVQTLLRETNGQAEYKHHKRILSIVNIPIAGMGTKRVRITNLPPEVQKTRHTNCAHLLSNSIGCNREKNGKRNYACRLHGPLRCRDTHYSTRHQPTDSSSQMDDGPHTDKQ